MLAMSSSPVDDKMIYPKCYVIWRTFHFPPTYLPITSIHSKNKLNIHRPAVFCGLCNGYHLFFNPSWLRNTNLWVTMIGLVIQESARHVPKSQSSSRRWAGFSIKRKVTDDFWQLLTLMLKPMQVPLLAQSPRLRYPSIVLPVSGLTFNVSG